MKQPSGVYSEMFRATENIFKNYLKCSQTGVVRLDNQQTPSNIEGLCTDGMSACVGIIIIGNDSKKISFMHTDLAVREEDIANECAWIGSPCKLYIVKGIFYVNPGFETHVEFNTKTIPRFTKAIRDKGLAVEINTESFKSSNGAIAVSRTGEIKQPADIRVGRPCPYIELRHCINMINADAMVMKGQYHLLDLQYDGTQWTTSPKLTAEALILVSRYSAGHRFNSETVDLDNNIKNYFVYCEQYSKQAKENNSEGVRYHKSGDYAKAVEAFAKAIQFTLLVSDENNQDLVSYYYNLGSAKIKLGDNEGAISDLKNAVNLSIKINGPQHQQTLKIQARLDECGKGIKPGMSASAKS